MAEDIKMNVFPQVTNAEYIYGELVDGSQVKINKNELACLIGAVIYSSSISDLDKIETSGIYSIGDKCENVPSESGQTQGCILFHLHWDIPGGLQIGGGIDAANAKQFLDAGASHVIVTSYVFRDGKLTMNGLQH